MEFLILPEYVIDTLYMGDLVGFELGVATRHDQDGIGVLPTDAMNHLAVLMVRRIGYGAGVDDA